MAKKELHDFIANDYPDSDVKIDILIPVIEKDLAVLPHVIDGARKYVKHPIGEIYIIAPQSNKIQKLCQDKHCKFIDEDTVMPITNKDIGSGWIYQQFLKMSGDTICSQKYFLVLDADTIFIAPHLFLHDGKMVIYCQNFFWHYDPIFIHYKKVTELEAVAPYSLINHYMFFSAPVLKELKKRIESIHGKPWYQAIMDEFDTKAYVPFSEYEMYGNYLLSHFPNEVMLANGKNLDYRIKHLKKFRKLKRKKLANKYNSISFHDRDEKEEDNK